MLLSNKSKKKTLLTFISSLTKKAFYDTKKYNF